MSSKWAVRAAAIAALSTLVLLFVWFALPDLATDRPGGTPPPTDGPTPTADDDPSPRLRTPIPKPVAYTPSAPDHAPEVADPGVGEDAPAAEPEDDSGRQIPAFHGATTDLAGDLKAAIAEVSSDLIECLQGWHEQQPDVFEGRVVFAFQLDDEGVAGMDVLDVQTVPEGTLTCLGDVLWEQVAWPAVDTPLEVTWPIQVSVDDDPDDE